MAKPGQHQQGASAHEPKSDCGGRQFIVELCEISTSGLVFWSRRRFEIGAEIQVCIHRDALPFSSQEEAATPAKWITLQGFVVGCPKHCRADGRSGFRVSLLVDHLACARKKNFHSRMRWLRSPLPWMTRFGLN